GSVSAVVGRFNKPRRFASSIHSSAYPSPLKMMRLWFSYDSRMTLRISSSRLPLVFSKRSAKRQRISATAVFRLILLQAMDCEEPSMRNSNLLPVKANGDVRLRSLVSWKNFGRLWTSTFKLALVLLSFFLL